MRIPVIIAALSVPAGAAAAEGPAPFPGAVSRWEGFVRHDFPVGGAGAVVVEPEKPLPGRPWAWRGEFFGAFPNADVELLKRGWHLAYLGVPDLFGSPKAVARWEAFYDTLVKDHGLSPRPGLIGLSRGALYCMAWAAAHPEKTLAVYLDNGVCDFKSWPGGKPKGLGAGAGSPEEWAKLLAAYDFKDDAAAAASRLNPVDRLAPLAAAKVPVLLVYGDSDRVVPHRENSEVVYERYKALGGPVERVVKPGKDHHPHGLVDPSPVVAFFERAWADRGKAAGGEADDLTRLQGTWQLIWAETDGVKAPEGRVEPVRVTITGDKHTVRFNDRVVAHDVSFAIDPSKSPKEVTDTVNDGPDTGKPIRGIYKLAGDTLVSCVAPAGKERPAAFAARAGTGATLRVFRRVRPDGASQAAVAAGERRKFAGAWRVVSMEAEGRPLPEAAFRDVRLSLEGAEFHMNDARGDYRGAYSVDPSATPKTIDIVFTDGPGAGKVVLGVYELEGDTYRLCVGGADQPRPNELAGTRGSGHVLEVLKRASP
jgi:uncharacterized protein (TIGR03067 family)